MSSAGDQEAQPRTVWMLLLGGPVIWFVHFMAVYLAAEIGCKLVRFDIALLGVPGVSVVTIGATVLAEVALVVATARALQRWRRGRGAGEEAKVAFAGILLGAFSVIAVVFTAVPALVLQPC